MQLEKGLPVMVYILKWGSSIWSRRPEQAWITESENVLRLSTLRKNSSYITYKLYLQIMLQLPQALKIKLNLLFPNSIGKEGRYA